MEVKMLFTTKFEEDRKTVENIWIQTLKKFIASGLKQEWFKHITIVTDEGANVKKAFEDQNRMSCAVHLTNTVLRNSFDKKFLKSTVIETLITKSKALVLKQPGNVCKLNTTVNQDVDTSWNSKLIMLESIIKNYDDIINLLDDELTEKFIL